MKSISVSRRSGFTLVELLIVIVVIAILATVSVVAYNGIQVRARNTARLAAAQVIYKQLEMYTRQTGKDFGNASLFCVPTEANIDLGDGHLTSCRSSKDPHYEDAVVNNNLSAQNLQFSYPSAPVVGSEDTYYGIEVTYFSSGEQGMGGVLRPRILSFYLEGSKQDCGPNSVKYEGTLVADDPLNSIMPAPYFISYTDRTLCTLSLTHYSTI